jgi:hypothetical protein
MNEMLADIYARSLHMLKMTIADFTDAQMLDRPVPGANNPLWQLGHLINSEARMTNGIPLLPQGFDTRYTRETAQSNNPKILGNKAELLALFEKIRNNSIQWVKSLSEADMAKPTPETVRHIFPTVGHLAHLLPQHSAMHIGQFQVLRRKLGLPNLF